MDSHSYKVLGIILKMDKGETQINGRKDKKKNGWLCTRLYIQNGLYESRKEGRRGPATVEDCVDKPIQELDNNIKKNKKD